MKKQTKIFAILLTLAIVIGVFAVGAAAYGHNYYADTQAPVAGETFISYSNFNNATLKQYANNATINANTNSPKKLQTANLTSPTTVEAIASAYNSADKYVQIYNTGTAAASNSFYLNLNTDVPTNSSGMTATDFETKFHDAGYTLKERQYQVLDFDVFFPDGTLSIKPSVGFEFRAFNASGARKDLRANAGDKLGYQGTNYTVRFEQDGDKILLKTMNGYSGSATFGEGVVIDRNEWSHITMVIEGVIVDRGNDDPYDDGIAIRCYTALNGTIIAVHTIEAPDLSFSSKYLDGDMTGIFCNQVKFNAVNIGKTDKMQLDDVALRAYTRGTYQGNLGTILAEGVGADLTKWERNSYVPAAMPHGNLIATNGETQYGNLAAAIAEAAEGATLEIQNSSNSKVVVNKAITLNLNGNQLPNIATAPGYAIKRTEESITITKATSALTVLWYECECGEGCIEEIETTVYSGNNIYESYKLATGHDPVCKGIVDGLNYSLHVGFEDASGLLEEFDFSMESNEDLEGETIELVPLYEEDSVIAIRTDSVGNETPIFASEGISNSTLKLAKGDTVKLMADIEMTKSNALSISVDNVTFDLNGKKIVSLNESVSSPDNRYSIFTVIANGFTLTSSQVGGAIFHVTMKAGGSGFQSGPVVSGAKDNTTVYFVGQNEAGETTLSIYSAMVFQCYNNPVTIDINGGHYISSGAADGVGMFYVRNCTSSYTIENAYFDGGNSALGFAGANGPASCSVYVKNCVFGTAKPASVYTFEGLQMTFENCYFGGEVNPRTVLNNKGEYIATPPTDAKATYIIKNCFVRSDVAVEGTFAEGQAMHQIDMTKTWQVVKNDTWSSANWENREALLALKTVDVTMTFDRMIAAADLQPVNVTWYAADGVTVLANSTAMPGSTASCPTTPVEGTNGYVVSTYVDWTKDTYIPLGTTGEVSFTLEEGATSVLQAGKIDIMFNFDMVNHLQYSHYIPVAPEGITYKTITIGGSIKDLGTKMATDPATGIKYYTVHSWPGIGASDSNYGCDIVFEYEGKEYTYNAPAMNIPKYVTYILTAEKYENATELRTAMADLIRFLKASKDSQGATVRTPLTQAYELATPFMSDASTAIDSTVANDLSAVEAYIDSIKLVYHTSLNGVTIQATTKEGYAATIRGVNNTVYGMNAIGDTRFVGSKYNAHNIRSWSMLNELVITIYKAEDVTVSSSNVVSANEGAVAVASANFNVEGIINADTAADETTVAFYQAACAYAKSGKAYVDLIKS